MFKGKPIMVRIKAKTMAAISYAPKNGYTLDQCSLHYGYYHHMPGQQLYDTWPSEVSHVQHVCFW